MENPAQPIDAPAPIPCDLCREHVTPIVDTWRGRNGVDYTDLLCPHCGLVLKAIKNPLGLRSAG